MRFFMTSRSVSPFLALAMIFFLSGCLVGKTNNRNLVSEEAGIHFASKLMSPSSYQQETQRWQAALQETADPKKNADAHLHLAALYLAKDNPQKNYKFGYVELTRATMIRPDLQNNMALASWLEVLRSLETESQNGKRIIAAFEDKLARSQQQINTQRQELVKLRETLDRLKRLDLSVERKRRDFK